jgi:diacylglycerol O-acyltransferase
MVAELPVDIADPVDRLHAVCRQMQELKASHQVEAGAALFKVAEMLPPAVFTAAIRGASALMRRVPQRMIHTVTTNVRGPGLPLYALGREMLVYLPFVPLSEGVRIGVAIVSYNGHIAFGITGDYATARDVQFMAHRIEAEVFALRERADICRLAPMAVAGG